MRGVCFYGARHCPTCDVALVLALGSGRPVRERDVLVDPLTWTELKHLAALAGGVRHILSVRARAYRTLGLDGPGVGEPALPAAMAREPSLLRRPIVMVDDVVLVGFDGDADAERAR